MSDIQPLILTYSASAGRLRATDNVNLAQLDAALGQITDKINEVIGALNINLRDDNALQDGIFLPRHMSDDFRAEVVSIANQAADA